MDTTSMLEALSHLTWPVINAVMLDFMMPRSLLWNVTLGVFGSPFLSMQAMQWITAGYVDTLDLTNEQHRSFIKLSVYIGTLFARRGIFLIWRLARLLAGYAWDNAYVLSLVCLCLAISWKYGPEYWKRRINSTFYSLGMWTFLLGPTHVVYGTAVFVSHAWAGMGVVKRALMRLILPSTPEFSYASATAFDPSAQIRLLKLHRRVPFFELSAELITCYPEEAPSYYTVSYVWSYGAQDLRSITLNGLSFQVKGNVHYILKRCSSFLRPQFIWIDTICIDQTNASEKTLQVRAMQDIYGKSKHALVCLGDGPGSLAFGLIEELKVTRKLYGPDSIAGYVAQFFERRKTDRYLAARIKALQELLQHPWFGRVWVVQEAVVPPEITIFYGRHSCPWETFYDSLQEILSGPFVSMFVALGAPGNQLELASKYMGILSMSFIVAYRREYRYFGPQRVNHVLRVFGEREATLPLDKVFALVGIARTYDTDLKQLVDYRSKSKDGVLLDLANFLFDNGEAFEVLYLAGIGRSDRNSSLPSWAVDWTMTRTGMPLNPEFTPAAMRYCAASSKVLNAVRGNSEREIVVRGQLFDRIVALVPVRMRAMDTQPATSLPFLQVSYLDEALKLAHGRVRDPYPYTANEPLEEAVWRTLIGDKTNTERPAPTFYGNVLATLTRGLVEMRDVLFAHSPEVMFSEAMTKKLKTEGSINVAKLQEFEAANAHAQNINFLFDSGKGSSPYVFCVTERGHIGMAPELSEVGDKIVLLHGMEVPYLMRGGSGRYQLVGDAYVHGIMDGEGLDVESTEEDLTIY